MLNHTFEFVHLQKRLGYIHTDVHQVEFLLDWWLARIYRTLLAAGAEDIQLTEVPGKVDMAEGWDGWKVWHDMPLEALEALVSCHMKCVFFMS